MEVCVFLCFYSILRWCKEEFWIMRFLWFVPGLKEVYSWVSLVVITRSKLCSTREMWSWVLRSARVKIKRFAVHRVSRQHYSCFGSCKELESRVYWLEYACCDLWFRVGSASFQLLYQLVLFIFEGNSRFIIYFIRRIYDTYKYDIFIIL